MLIYVEREDLRPKRSHDGDAGLDLRAKENYFITEGGGFTAVHTGVYLDMGQASKHAWNKVGFIFPRSSLGKKGLYLSNSVGVIDLTYRGELICMMGYTRPHISDPFSRVIDSGERIAQLVIMECNTENPTFVDSMEAFTNTNRGTGGFGSSGKY
jgi:dUTP pyrophosphatase